MSKGKLIVIEGVDGSGKETQSRLLHQYLLREKTPVLHLSYPRYEKESSALVKMYLRGDFGSDPDAISPYVSSTFFAADRYASYKTEYEAFYMDGGWVLADRFTTSNMIHQGGKIADLKERKEFLDWLVDYEYRLYEIPRPDVVFFLDLPPEISLERIRERSNKITKEKEKDIHESNRQHLFHAYEAACRIAGEQGWHRIDCMDGNRQRSVEEIHGEIVHHIKKLGGQDRV
ncbi:thymidylate kinase [Alkalibacter rhizosphaerae]|uniref:Thymidylate kinase n=1 Tax=Alkalibacter rhizosphaerae TaxID=2815577 RepID=A0A975AH37_9FIRM|nr:thymidylate kinase [Alkalibacter rhizosphaerae]QSX07598.1 thymidylate kinase [Alkalibacter rhizosphaerae]